MGNPISSSAKTIQKITKDQPAEPVCSPQDAQFSPENGPDGSYLGTVVNCFGNSGS
jgi:hypothetical protein